MAQQLDSALLRRQYEAMDQARSLAGLQASMQSQMQPLRMESLAADIEAKRQAYPRKLADLARKDLEFRALLGLRDRSQQATERYQQGRLAQMANRPVREPLIRPITIADPDDPTKGIVVDANTGRKLGDRPPKAAAEKALPTSAAQKLMENQQNLRRAEQALTLLEGGAVGEAKGDPEAVGKKGFLASGGDVGNYLLNAIDPSGVDTRAAIADLGSLVIHDRSGAAVTAAEYPRLRPFIPQASDNPDVARKKLRRFVQEYRNTVGETTDFYTESGYKVPAETLRPSGGMPATGPTKIKNDAEFDALPSGAVFVGPDGKQRKKP